VPGFGTKDIADSGTGHSFENRFSAPQKVKKVNRYKPGIIVYLLTEDDNII
jgi:hypothetical protein